MRDPIRLGPNPKYCSICGFISTYGEAHNCEEQMANHKNEMDELLKIVEKNIKIKKAQKNCKHEAFVGVSSPYDNIKTCVKCNIYEVDALRQKITHIKKVLEKNSYPYCDVGDDRFCVECYSRKSEGHKENCEIGKILNGT